MHSISNYYKTFIQSGPMKTIRRRGHRVLRKIRRLPKLFTVPAVSQIMAMLMSVKSRKVEQRVVYLQRQGTPSLQEAMDLLKGLKSIMESSHNADKATWNKAKADLNWLWTFPKLKELKTEIIATLIARPERHLRYDKDFSSTRHQILEEVIAIDELLQTPINHILDINNKKDIKNSITELNSLVYSLKHSKLSKFKQEKIGNRMANCLQKLYLVAAELSMGDAEIPNFHTKLKPALSYIDSLTEDELTGLSTKARKLLKADVEAIKTLGKQSNQG